MPLFECLERTLGFLPKTDKRAVCDSPLKR